MVFVAAGNGSKAGCDPYVPGHRRCCNNSDRPFAHSMDRHREKYKGDLPCFPVSMQT